MINSTALIQGGRFVVLILSSFLKEILRDIPMNHNLVSCTRAYRAAHSDVLSGVERSEGDGCTADAQYPLGATGTLRWEDDLLVEEYERSPHSACTAIMCG